MNYYCVTDNFSSSAFFFLFTQSLAFYPAGCHNFIFGSMCEHTHFLPVIFWYSTHFNYHENFFVNKKPFHKGKEFRNLYIICKKLWNLYFVCNIDSVIVEESKTYVASTNSVYFIFHIKNYNLLFTFLFIWSKLILVYISNSVRSNDNSDIVEW